MAKENLTVNRIRALQAGASQRFLWDAATPGLAVRVTPKGSKAFIFQGKLNGDAIRITIGDTNSWSIPEAQAEARSLAVTIDKGIDPRDAKAAQASQAKLKAAEEEAERRRLETTGYVAWERYLSAHQNLWGKTHYQDHRNAARRGGEKLKISARLSVSGPLEALLSHPLCELTHREVGAWLERELPGRKTTTHNAFRKFRAFVSWCESTDEFSHLINPACCSHRSVTKLVPTKQTRQGDSLLKSQLATWLQSVRAIPSPIIAGYLECLLLTGARRNELAELKWEHVDLKWDVLLLKDKIDGTRKIPLTPRVKEILERLPQRNAFVFSSPSSKSGHIVSPNKRHGEMLKAANLPHVSLHGLRRTFNTLAANVDAPAGVVAQLMGHKPSAISEKSYQRRELDFLREWHVKIENWLLSQ